MWGQALVLHLWEVSYRRTCSHSSTSAPYIHLRNRKTKLHLYLRCAIYSEVDGAYARLLSVRCGAANKPCVQSSEVIAASESPARETTFRFADRTRIGRTGAFRRTRGYPRHLAAARERPAPSTTTAARSVERRARAPRADGNCQGADGAASAEAEVRTRFVRFRARAGSSRS